MKEILNNTLPVLTLTDEVCDICSAKALYTAYKIVKKNNRQLFLCGSHTRKNAKALKEQGFTINPDTYKEYGAETIYTKKVDNTELYVTPEPNIFDKETLQEVSDTTAKVILEEIVPNVRKELNYDKEITLRIHITVDKEKELVEFDIIIEPVIPAETAEEQKIEEKFKNRIYLLTKKYLNKF